MGTRLAKLLRFTTSGGKLSSLSEYVERMKDKQEHIFYMAGGSVDEVKTSPFVERLLKKGYEVIYLTEAVDEYAISALPEFEGKKFQNVAKEGFSIDGDTEAAKARKAQIAEKFEPLTKWLGDDALKDHILRAEVSERLVDSPCALITSKFGWTSNMQKIIQSQTPSDERASEEGGGQPRGQGCERHGYYDVQHCYTQVRLQFERHCELCRVN